MTAKSNAWAAEYFAQANPVGRGRDDVPSLLRRVARTIEGMGPVDVQDLVLHRDVTAKGSGYSLTVYFHRVRAKPVRKRKQRGHG